MVLYCALVAPNVEEAVVLAVNHSGDSDSTGAVAGNICGALFGAETILARWADFVELHDEITAMADDLAAQRGKAGRDHRSPLEPVSGLVTHGVHEQRVDSTRSK